MSTLARCTLLAVVLLSFVPRPGTAQAVAHPTKASASTPHPAVTCATSRESFEYAELIYTGLGDGTALGPFWFSPDTSITPALDSVAKDENASKGSGGTLLQLLNVLGAAGWEIISVPPRPGAPYLLKRRTDCAKTL